MISDISSIRVNVWPDMSADIVGGKDISLGPGATNDGSALITTGAANSWAQATGYKPVFSAQGTVIFRAYFPSGCSGASTPMLANDGGGSPFLGFQGQYFIVNNNFCQCRPNSITGGYETVVGTWGPAGLKGYTNGLSAGTNAFTGTPNTPTFDLTFGALDYNGGKVQNIAMTMDFFAILNRQLSDAEVLDLSATPSQMWAAGGGGASGKRAKRLANLYY